MARFGFRKFVNLFKRSQSQQKDELHERLFPDVPSIPVAETTLSPPTVITELIRRILAKPAHTVLCAHTVTVGPQTSKTFEVIKTDVSTKAASREASVIIDIDTTASQDIELVEIGPATVAPVPTTVDSSTQTEPVVEEVPKKPSVVADTPVPRSEVPAPTTRSTAKSTLSEKVDDVHEDDVLATEEAKDGLSYPVPQSPNSTESCTDLGPESLDQVQEVVHSTNPKGESPVDSRSQPSEDEDDNDDDDSDDDEEEELVDPDDLRGNWEPIMAISQHRFALALLQHLPKDHGISAEDVRCTSEIKGGFNFVRVLKIDTGICAGHYIIKVPCTGTVSRWQEADAYMLRNDARTMAYISQKTTIPCPEVLGYSDSLSNVLTAPYVIMRANKGIPSNQIWFEADDGDCDDLANAYKPTPERMAIRINFLRSLASQMAKLQTLEFPAAGTLNFDNDPANPEIGPTYHWKETFKLLQLSIPELGTSASINCIPPISTAEEYFMTPLNQHWPKDINPTSHINNGRRHTMERILASPPFTSHTSRASHESFVLRHDDLDFQNILCDEAGNVTGIIDWDKVRTAPRCLGFASLPAFLIKDWTPDFTSYAEAHMPWELDEYRNVYARAMLEACEDGKYTLKSAIYQAVDAALYGGHAGGSIPSVVRKVLKELTTTRKFDDADVLTTLGQGWEQGAGRVAREIEGLVALEAEVEVVVPRLFEEE